MNIDEFDIADIFADTDEAVNGIEISEFRRIVKQYYPFIKGGVFVDYNLETNGLCTPFLFQCKMLWLSLFLQI